MGPLEVLIVLLCALSIVPALVVTAMKGRWVLLVIGLFLWPVAFVGAFMPARPGSYWLTRREGTSPPSPS